MFQGAPPRPPRLAWAGPLLCLALGCNSTIGDPDDMSWGDDQPGPGPSTGGIGNGSGGAGTTTGGVTNPGGGVPGSPMGGSAPGAGAAGGPVAGVTCDGDVVAEPKRVVRLSFNQLSLTIRSLFGETLGDKIDADFEIGAESPVARTFPPLAGAREGGQIATSLWTKVDQIASTVGSYVLANLNQVTQCGTAPTDACATTYIKTLAERAYRRPLTAEETTSITKVYDDVKAIYGTVPEAIQHSVYAVMQSPQLLYRTELGTAANQPGPLSAFELASNLSYFLTDGPPDAALLDAARQNRLSAPADIAREATRLLETPAARKNLEGAMFSYFQLDNLTTVKIDDPAFTQGTAENPFRGVRESSYREAELFMQNALWNGPVGGLLTSKKTSINTTLASLYGITLPAQRDESTFVTVDLPENRAGLLTQVAFLASNSRPDVPSVVARGLVVDKALLCSTNPPFPEDEATVAAIEASNHALADATERAKAEYRSTTAPCLGCHRNFDAYGLALDTYDIIGRYRTMDPEGRLIDPSVTLPPSLGGSLATNTVDMGRKIAESPGFSACVARNMLAWALAEGSQLTPRSCSTRAVVAGFEASDKSFTSLLREIAVSQAFTHRNVNAGVTQ